MKIVDQIYHCQMPGQEFGDWHLQCHLRIFHSQNGIQTVMVTDMGFEVAWFNPYVIEVLATQVVNEFQLEPTKLVWLECYVATPNQLNVNDLSQVTFDWYNRQATNPQWSAIAPEAAKALMSKELLLA